MVDPTDDDVFFSMKTQPSRLLEVKAATLIIVGIPIASLGEDTRPILYSIARFEQEMKKKWRPNPQVKEQYPDRFKNWSQYQQFKRFKLDEQGNVDFANSPRNQVPLPIPLEEVNPDERRRQLQTIPSEAFSEVSSPADPALNYEDPEVGLMAPTWWKQQQALIYRRETTLIYNPNKDVEVEEAILKATKLIRNAFWMAPLPVAEVKHTAYTDIDPDKLHEAIIGQVRRFKNFSLQREAGLSPTSTNLEEGYEIYKVVVVDPKGITTIFDTVEQALKALESSMLQESLPLAASLTKKEQRQLVIAASILSKKFPVIATSLEVIATKLPIESNDSLSKTALIQSLTRVANNFDNLGESKIADLADELLHSLVEK